MTTPEITENDWTFQLIDGLAEAQPSPPPLKDLFIRLNDGLFHYTTADGLTGIIEGNCLWATAASYLNDASEIEYGYAVLREVLANWEDAESNEDSLSMTAVSCLKALYMDNDSRLDRATTVYVACFCTRRNLLSQWRAYGQAGGYSIGFHLFGTGLPEDSAKAFGGLKPEGEGYRASVMPVVYKRAEQFAIIKDTLKRNLEALERPELRQIYEALNARGRQQFVAKAILLIDHFLVGQLVAFKNEAFEEENEWRIVVRPKFGRRTASKGERDDAVHLRTARGLIIPYVKLVPANNYLPIQSITIGPTLEKARAERSLRLLLIQNDLGGSVDIRGSDIPVVF